MHAICLLCFFLGKLVVLKPVEELSDEYPCLVLLDSVEDIYYVGDTLCCAIVLILSNLPKKHV